MNPRRPSSTILPAFLLALFFPVVASAAELLAPAQPRATAASSSAIDLSWTDINVKLVQATETGYSIERTLSTPYSFVHIGTTAKGVTTYRDTGLASSTTYLYRVRALGRNGVVSPYSSVVFATTFANGAIADVTPPVVSITSPASGTLYSTSQTVSITASASDDVGVTKVEFYDGTTLMSTDTTSPYAHAWSFTSANNGTHSWTAKAYDASGKSTISAAVSATVNIAVSDTAAPSIPTGLTGAAAGCSQVNLSWTGSSDTGGSGLAGYRVYRNGVQIGTTSATSYSSTGLAASTGYSFTVAAYDNAGNASAQSTAASATTPACSDTTAPSIPTGLTGATAGCSQVNLSWTASSDTGGSGLAGYRVYRNGVQIGTTSATSYSSTGLAASTGYSFTVAAYDNAGNASAQSTAASATTPACADTAAPSIPTGLTGAAAGCSQVNLSWTASSDTGGSGLAGYRVYRNGVQIGTTSATSYSSTGLAASTGYSFTVAAYDNAGNASAQSTAASATTPACADTAAPSIPTGLTSTAAGCSQVNLSWTASSDTGGSGLAGYRVYRNGVQIATTSATSYSSTGLAASTGYSFTVAAYDNAGNASAQSSAASVTTPACADTAAPSIPTGLTGAAAGCSQVNLSWTGSSDTGGSGLAGYRVYRNGVQIATTSVASYSSTGLAASTGYSFTVAAYDNAGNASAQGTAASATTPACADTAAPSIPTGLTAAAAGCSQVNLSWTGSSDTGGSGLAGYRVYRNGVQIATTSVASYSSTGLAASTGYSFTVAAYDNAGNASAQSAAASATTPACADTAAPSIPTGLTAAAAGCSQVNLSWTGSSDTGGSGLAGYRVYRNGVQIATTSVASYSSTGLAASTGYSFTVAAYDNAGNLSTPSTAASATTPACADTAAPSIPTGLTATPTSCSQVNLSWTASTDTGGSGLAGYKIFRGGVQIGTATTASYSNTGLAGSTAYSFTVAAYDNAGNTSAQSTAASATTPACGQNLPPVAKAGPDQTATVGASINFNGSGSTDSDGYISAYSWNFGDGGTAVGAYVSHVFLSAGTFTVTLTVTDNLGARGTDTALVDTATLGALAWNKHFGGPNVADAAISHGVAVDTGGSALVVGEFTGSVNFGGGPLTSAGDSDVFLVKYSATGAYLWSKRFGGTGSDKGYGVAVDSAGNVVIVGYFSGVGSFGGAPLTTAGNTDIFVAKYSPAGDHLWSRGFGSTGIDYAMGVAVDRNSDVVVTGYFGLFGGPIDFGGGPLTSAGDSDVFVAKFSAAGAHVWSKRAGGPGTDRGLAIAVDAGGNMAITGWFSQSASFGGSLLTSAGYSDLFVAEYSATGAHLWSKRFGGVSSDVGNSIAIDSGGNVIVTGDFNGSINFGGSPLVSNESTGNMFLVKFSSAGNHVWSKRFGNGNNSAHGVTTDAAGNVLMTGTLSLPTDFGGGILWGNTWDLFLAKFTSAGAYIWAKRVGAGYEDSGEAVASDASGNVILTGFYYTSVDFGGGAMSSPGGNDTFLVRFGP